MVWVPHVGRSNDAEDIRSSGAATRVCDAEEGKPRALGGVEDTRKRHCSTIKQIKNNWRALEGMVSMEAVQVLRVAGTAATYTSQLRSMLKKDDEDHSRRIMAATVNLRNKHCFLEMSAKQVR